MDDPKKKIAFLILREQSPSEKTIKRSPRIYPEFRETLQKNDQKIKPKGPLNKIKNFSNWVRLENSSSNQSYLSSKCPFLHLK